MPLTLTLTLTLRAPAWIWKAVCVCMCAHHSVVYFLLLPRHRAQVPRSHREGRRRRQFWCLRDTRRPLIRRRVLSSYRKDTRASSSSRLRRVEGSWRRCRQRWRYNGVPNVKCHEFGHLSTEESKKSVKSIDSCLVPAGKCGCHMWKRLSSLLAWWVGPSRHVSTMRTGPRQFGTPHVNWCTGRCSGGASGASDMGNWQCHFHTKNAILLRWSQSSTPRRSSQCFKYSQNIPSQGIYSA